MSRGPLRVQVIEGSIAELVVKGEGPRLRCRAALQPVLAEKPAHLDTLQRQLLLLNDRPAAHCRSQLEEDRDRDRRFRLIVQVQTWRIYCRPGLIISAPPRRSLAGYSTAVFNSLGVAGDTLAVNLSTFRTIRASSSSAASPMRRRSASMAPHRRFGVSQRCQSRRRSPPFDTRTRTDSAELRGSFASLKSQIQALTLTLSAAITEAASDDVFGAIYRDHVRTLGLSADYKLQDGFQGKTI